MHDLFSILVQRDIPPFALLSLKDTPFKANWLPVRLKHLVRRRAMKHWFLTLLRNDFHWINQLNFIQYF